MPRLFKRDINFLGNRKIFYIISAVLLAVSLLAIAFNGLHFGIEFSGGTSTTFDSTGDITTEQMREAFDAAGDTEAVIQTTEVNGQQGFLVRTSITDPDVAAAHAAQVAEQLELSDDSYQISVVGPDWGQDVKNRSLIAFFVSIIAIIIYIAIRFEYKMGLTAIAALIHDLVIVVGIYALVGREITPNVVAALLTIMGYSLYDTVVVFHRMTENAKSEEIRTSFWKMANHSINQVFTRTVNTTLTSLIPVLCMLFFGGATLTDFAFAMAIGLVIGSYSSIAVASPLYVTWKSREQKFARMNNRHPDDLLPAREIRRREAAGIPVAETAEDVFDDKPADSSEAAEVAEGIAGANADDLPSEAPAKTPAKKSPGKTKAKRKKHKR